MIIIIINVPTDGDTLINPDKMNLMMLFFVIDALRISALNLSSNQIQLGKDLLIAVGNQQEDEVKTLLQDGAPVNYHSDVGQKCMDTYV